MDLAGSERYSYSSTPEESKVTKEGIEINKSLFTLKQVISILSENSRTGANKYVPFRESKLTTLLKQSLGGRSK